MTREDKYTRDVKGYEGRYKVNALGEVFSVKRNIKLSETIDCNGYVKFCLYKDGKRHQVKLHRIVAEAFIPNPNNYKVVNHLDGGRLNNHVSNLEWCTYKENAQHAIKHKLRKDNKPIIQLKDCIKVNEFESIREASRCTKIDNRRICHNLKGNIKQTDGFTWEYKEVNL